MTNAEHYAEVAELLQRAFNLTLSSAQRMTAAVDAIRRLDALIAELPRTP